MGLSNILPGGGGQGAAPADGAAPATDATAAPAHQDFGQRLGSHFESKYPVAGGLAQAVFGGSQASASQPATAPLVPMPQAGQQDMSMLAMNAQPKQGGGLEALLKLFV